VRAQASKLRRELAAWLAASSNDALSRSSTMSSGVESSGHGSPTEGEEASDEAEGAMELDEGDDVVGGVVQVLEALVLEGEGAAAAARRSRRLSTVLAEEGAEGATQPLSSPEVGTEGPGLGQVPPPLCLDEGHRGLEVAWVDKPGDPLLNLSVLTESTCEEREGGDESEGHEGASFVIRRRSNDDPSPPTSSTSSGGGDGHSTSSATPSPQLSSPLRESKRRSPSSPDHARASRSPRLSLDSSASAGSKASAPRPAAATHCSFATPMASKSKPDWGVSSRANTESLLR
jgi:hypothetical protein